MRGCELSEGGSRRGDASESDGVVLVEICLVALRPWIASSSTVLPSLPNAPPLPSPLVRARRLRVDPASHL